MTTWRKVVLIFLLSATSFVWYVVFSQNEGVLKVFVLDVGQGDAIFIETPSGNQILIDGGPGRKVLSELGRVMPGYDKTIDMLVSTHTDYDHLAGLVEVAKNYDIGAVLENGISAETSIYNTWDTIIKEKNITRRSVEAGDQIVLDREVFLNIFGPTEIDFEEGDGGNEVMVVAQLVYGENEFLFMGDIERGDELRLAHSNASIQSDVLKIAHHGSKNSSTDLFLEDVDPDIAVISVGEANRYDHPHPETLSRLESLGATLLRTDRDGRVTFVSNGETITVE